MGVVVQTLFNSLHNEIQNHLRNAIPIPQYLIIPESHHSKALRFQPNCALLIVPNLHTVLTAIDLDYQPLLETNKINNIRPQHLLPAKFHAGYLATVNFVPQYTFRISQTFTQCACLLDGCHNAVLATTRLLNPV
jgi:hypothetical protein